MKEDPNKNKRTTHCNLELPDSFNALFYSDSVSMSDGTFFFFFLESEGEE